MLSDLIALDSHIKLSSQNIFKYESFNSKCQFLGMFYNIIERVGSSFAHLRTNESGKILLAHRVVICNEIIKIMNDFFIIFFKK